MNTNNIDPVRINAYMPITVAHDYSQPAIGRMETTDDGKIILSFNKNSTVTAEQLGKLYEVAPVYNVLETDKKGRVIKAELIGISVIGRWYEEAKIYKSVSQPRNGGCDTCGIEESDQVLLAYDAWLFRTEARRIVRI